MSRLSTPPMTPIALLLAATVAAGCQAGTTDRTPARTTDQATGSATDQADSATGRMGLSVPERLLQSRIVDRSTLRPQVTLSDGRSVSLRRIDATTWSGTVLVAPNSDIEVRVVWLSELAQGALALAQLRRTVAVGPRGASLVADGAAYDYQLDRDGDGVTNLLELEAGTDPFSSPAFDQGLDADPNPNIDGDDSDGDGEPRGGDGEPVDPIEPARPTGPVDPIEPDGPDRPIEPDDPLPDVADRPSVDVFVPRIARQDAPTIDGRNVRLDRDGTLLGEWAGAVQVDAGGLPLGIDALMIDAGAEAPSGTPWRSWAAMHDGEFLYVVVIVEDDGARRGDSARFFQDDSLELFVDGDGSRLTRYGDADDHHLIVPLLEPGTRRRPNANGIAGFEAGPNSPGRDIELTFFTGPGVGPDGLRRPRFERDVYELRLDLDSVDILPGRPFGFELQVNDDDDGGPRDSKWGWAHPERDGVDVDFTVVDPSFMGTLQLD